MGRAVGTATLLVVLVVTPAIRAAQQESPLRTREEVDLTLIATFGLLWLVPEFGIKEQMAIAPFDPLSYQDIGDMDRSAMGRWNPDIATGTDVLIGVAFTLPFVVNGIDDAVGADDRYEPARWLWNDFVIIVECVLFTGALTNLAKMAFTRYRPFMYLAHEETFAEEYAAILADDELRTSYEEAIEENDAAMSFWSGHSSLTFSASVAMATLMTYKHPDAHPAALIGMWGGAIALGTTVAIMRVQAGKHFPSDVIVGSLVGVASGVVIPSLHRNRDRLPVAIVPRAGRHGGGVTLALVW